MEDFMKIVKSLEESGLPVKGLESNWKQIKKTKGGFLGMAIGTLGATLLGNLLARKGATATIQGRGMLRAGEGISLARQGF